MRLWMMALLCVSGWAGPLAAQDAKPQAETPSEASPGILYPIDVAVDGDGVVYVADRQLPGIWTLKDGKSEVFFQAEKKFRTPLNAIRCLAVDAENRLFAGCSTTTEIFRFDEGKPVPLSGGNVSVPMNMIVDGDQVIVCDLKMRFLDSVPASGGTLKELAEIQGAKAVAKDGESYLVLTGTENPILKVNPLDGSSEVVVKGRPFNFPADMVRLDDGTLIVSDSYERCLWKVTDGKPEKWIQDDRFSNPVGLALHQGQVIVCDSRANAVFAVATDGEVSVLWQGTPTP